MNTDIDIRDDLASIRAPTLVLHRAGDRDMNIEEGRYLGALDCASPQNPARGAAGRIERVHEAAGLGRDLHFTR